MDVFYNWMYAASDFAFDTTRKSAEIYRALDSGPIPGVEFVDPYAVVPVEEIETLVGTMHANSYVQAVIDGRPKALAKSNGFKWDPGIYPMALAHTAGMVAAARQVATTRGFAGTLSSGMHHAKRRRGDGYCTFNGIAAAVIDTLQHNHDARIVIFDVDAHCGGGTEEMVGSLEAVTHIDVYVNGFDLYPESPGNHLIPVDDIEGHREAISGGVGTIVRAHQETPFDLCIYNAGVDPIDETFINPHDLRVRDHFVAGALGYYNIPTVFCMAGGYAGPLLTTPELVDLHTYTIAAFADADDARMARN